MAGLGAGAPGLMRSGPLASTPTPDQAQHSVEFLSQRFCALFAQLHREEAELKAATARNELLERRLVEIRRREEEQHAAGYSEVRSRLLDVEKLREEVKREEQRAASGSDEASALTAAAVTYQRQVERYRDQYRQEQVREHAARASALRQGEEMRELRRQCHDLTAELNAAESSKNRVVEELRCVEQGTSQAVKDVARLEKAVQEERRRCEHAECTAKQQHRELHELEQRVARKAADCEDLGRQMEQQYAEGRNFEQQLLQLVEKRARCQDDYVTLQGELRQRRREGAEFQIKLAEQTRELQQLRERLHMEKRLQREEQQVSQAVGAKLEHLRVQMPAAEQALRVAEGELESTRRRLADVREHCNTQQAWRDEQLMKRDQSKNALERLREEIRQLAAKRVKMQQEVDDVTQERSRLEVEVEVMTPALQDVWRRCRELEDRLASRVQELGLEAEKVRRCKAEASAARGRLSVLERHNEVVGARLREYRSLERNFGAVAGDRSHFKGDRSITNGVEHHAHGLELNCSPSKGSRFIPVDPPVSPQQSLAAPRLQQNFTSPADGNDIACHGTATSASGHGYQAAERCRRYVELPLQDVAAQSSSEAPLPSAPPWPHPPPPDERRVRFVAEPETIVHLPAGGTGSAETCPVPRTGVVQRPARSASASLSPRGRASADLGRHLPSPTPPDPILGGPKSPARTRSAERFGYGRAHSPLTRAVSPPRLASTGDIGAFHQGSNQDAIPAIPATSSRRSVACDGFAPDASGARGGIRNSGLSSGSVDLRLSSSTNVGGFIEELGRGDFGEDAVRFLCDFVAREEERLGLNPRAGPSSMTSPRTPPPLPSASAPLPALGGSGSSVLGRGAPPVPRAAPQRWGY